MSEDILFEMEVAPTVLLRDPRGGEQVVAHPGNAAAAIAYADDLYGLSGTGKIVDVLGLVEDEEGVGYVDLEDLDPNPFLVFYQPFEGWTPFEGEIARAVGLIARAEVEIVGATGRRIRASGSRSVVYPEKPGGRTGGVPMMVSRTIWYNANRAVTNLPCEDGRFAEEVLEDVNRRLAQADLGQVSLPR